MQYKCPECGKVAKNRSGLTAHFRMGHAGLQLNWDEVEQIEDAGGDGGNGSTAGVDKVVEKKVPKKENVETFPEEFPTDPPELFNVLLKMKGVPGAQADMLTREFRMSKWIWNDAQEIVTLLKGAKLGVSNEWIRGFIKQYGHAVEIPAEESGVAFVGGSRRGLGEDFLGTLEGGGRREDPITSFIRYQMYKDSRKDERDSGARSDPAAAAMVKEVREEGDSRMGALERSLESLMAAQSKLMETMEDDRRRAEQEKRDAEWSAKVDALNNKIDKLTAGGLGAGGADPKLSDRLIDLQKELAEAREKRLEDMVSSTNALLDQARKEITDAKDALARAQTDVVADHEARRRTFKKELEDEGWASRKKSAEESTMEMFKDTVVPGVISEVREGRKLIEKALTGGITPPTGGTPPDAGTGAKPASPEEAEKMSELLVIEQKLKGAQ